MSDMEPRNHFGPKPRRARPIANLCVNCREKWAQSKLGLCRTCERLVLGTMNAQQRREEELSEEAQAQARRRLKLAPFEPFREVVDEGRVFVIVWPRYRIGELPGLPS